VGGELLRGNAVLPSSGAGACTVRARGIDQVRHEQHTLNLLLFLNHYEFARSVGESGGPGRDRAEVFTTICGRIPHDQNSTLSRRQTLQCGHKGQ